MQRGAHFEHSDHNACVGGGPRGAALSDGRQCHSTVMSVCVVTKAAADGLVSGMIHLHPLGVEAGCQVWGVPCQQHPAMSQ